MGKQGLTFVIPHLIHPNIFFRDRQPHSRRTKIVAFYELSNVLRFLLESSRGHYQPLLRMAVDFSS